MDGYNDLYIGDQFYSDRNGINVDSVGLPSGGRRSGYFEDVLRYSQFKQPASLYCANPNPYIQDNISKSQRHNPIRTCDIRNREQALIGSSCDPGLYAPAIPVANNQKLYYVNDAIPQNCLSCSKNAGKEGFNGDNGESGGMKTIKSTPIEIDGTTLLIIFIFIVLVFMCCSYWKSIGDINEKLAAIKQSIPSGK